MKYPCVDVFENKWSSFLRCPVVIASNSDLYYLSGELNWLNTKGVFALNILVGIIKFELSTNYYDFPELFIGSLKTSICV